MATWGDILAASLQDLGVLQAGEAASGEDQAYCLSRLNRLLDQWASERLQITHVVRTTWTISTGDGSYTVGTGADINIARPVYVDGVSYIDTSVDADFETPLGPLTDAEYRMWEEKAGTATNPTNFYYNPTVANATLLLLPVPTSSTLTGVIYAPTALAQVTSTAATATLAPGYKRMIETNLALEIAPGFEKEPSQSLVLQARDSMQKVKRANFRLADLGFDPGVLQQAYWYTS